MERDVSLLQRLCLAEASRDGQGMAGALAPLPPSEAPESKADIPSAQRRLWEFQGYTICRLLGLTFDEGELRGIFKKLKLQDGRQLSLSESEMHGMLVQKCGSPNQVSKYVDKVLRNRFEPYGKVIEGLAREDICRLIEGGDGAKNIPLPALIWFAARNHCKDIEQVEARVFAAVHIKEHRALRLYDTLSRILPEGRVENMADELKAALARNEELERRYKRAGQKKEQLRLEIKTIEKDKSRLASDLLEQQQLNDKLRRELEKLGSEPALEQIEALKGEIGLLHEEIDTLTEELLKQRLNVAPNRLDESIYQEDNVEGEPIACGEIGGKQEALSSLNGMKVAFVGGMESLVPHYKQMVECLGGVFCDHCGKLSSGKPERREMEGLVDKADVVFCPVDMNSHNNCRFIKRACKFRNKPCCFLRSSSLSMFRRELLDFTKDLS